MGSPEQREKMPSIEEEFRAIEKRADAYNALIESDTYTESEELTAQGHAIYADLERIKGKLPELPPEDDSASQAECESLMWEVSKNLF